MKRMMVYPYDKYIDPVIRYQNVLMMDYSITKIVTLKIFGLVGSKVSCQEGENQKTYIVEDDFFASLNEVDAVLIVDTNIKIDFEKVIFPKINLSLEAGKEVIIHRTLTEKEEALVAGLQCIYKKPNEIKVSSENSFYRIEKVSIPIIMVFGVGERTDKFEVQLSLREQLMEKGYKVSQICSRQHCEFMGIHSFPEFMFQNNILEKEKIFRFNNYIKEIELQEMADVLIIGIPGTIIPMNDVQIDDFGVLAFEVSQAVQADAVVCTLHYGTYTKEYLDMMKSLSFYRFGMEIDCFTINNVMIDYNITEELGEKCYITVEDDLVDIVKNKINSSEALYNISNTEERKQITVHIIDELSSYPDIKIS